jgi:hypothetical protein
MELYGHTKALVCLYLDCTCVIKIEDLLTQYTEMKALLEEINHCPRNVDRATVPKAGIDSAPEQVVFEMSIGLPKIREIERLIK